MSPVVTTILTSLLSTIVMPWLTSKIPSLDPASQSAISSWLITTINGVLVGATTGVAHLLHLKAAPVVPAPVVKSVAKIMLAVALLPMMFGCSSVANFLSTPSNSLTITASAVEVGVSSLIEAQPAQNRAGLAATIVNTAKALQAVDSNDQVTISGFEVLAAQRIAKANLSGPQQEAINAAIQAAVNAITGKVNSGVLSPSQQTAINTVLNWLIVGATPYLSVS